MEKENTKVKSTSLSRPKSAFVTKQSTPENVELSKNPSPKPFKPLHAEGPSTSRRETPKLHSKPRLKIAGSERNLLGRKSQTPAPISRNPIFKLTNHKAESPINQENLRKLLVLRNMQKKRKSTVLLQPQFNPKEKWKRASKVLSAIHRLGYIAKELQLYGNPAFANDRPQYRRLAHAVNPDACNEKGSKAFKKKTEKSGIKYWFLIQPNSKFKIFWMIVMIIIMLYVISIQPLRLAFIERESKDAWFAIQLVVDIILFFDIIITCCTTYLGENGKLIKSHKILFWNYVKTIWFYSDLMAAFPYSLVMTLNGAYEKQKYATDEDYNQKYLRLYELIKMLVFFKWMKGESATEIINLLANKLQMNMSIFFCKFCYFL